MSGVGTVTVFCIVTMILTTVNSSGGDNLALSRPVEANTKYSEDNGAKNAVDGNRNSNYHSQVTDSPKWLRVDLGVIYSVNKIEIDHKFIDSSSKVNNNVYFLSTNRDIQPDRRSEQWKTLLFRPDALPNSFGFPIDPAIEARYISVYSEATRTSTQDLDSSYDEAGGILGFSELRVFAAPKPDAVESTVQTCNPPVLIANGQITLSEEPPIEGTTMTYVCDHGFRTPGNGCSRRVCQVLNGMADWSGDQVKFRCVRDDDEISYSCTKESGLLGSVTTHQSEEEAMSTPKKGDSATIVLVTVSALLVIAMVAALAYVMMRRQQSPKECSEEDEASAPSIGELPERPETTRKVEDGGASQKSRSSLRNSRHKHRGSQHKKKHQREKIKRRRSSRSRSRHR